MTSTQAVILIGTIVIVAIISLTFWDYYQASKLERLLEPPKPPLPLEPPRCYDYADGLFDESNIYHE